MLVHEHSRQRAIAQARLAVLGGADDVGEEHGGEDALELGLLVPDLAHESLDRLDVCVGVLLQ